MSKNPYKDYYKASMRSDEWAGVDAANARKRIKDIEYANSWTGEKENFNEEYQFSDGS